ncbi:hypothetical protein ECML606-1_000123 [Escherichia phage ECML-606-1]|nr:hypothetical protein ECML606-1_000123 [Escherichia phage ECML-606-1]
MANESNNYSERPTLADATEAFRAAMFDAGIEYHGEILPSLAGSPPDRFRPEDANHGEPGWFKFYYDDRPAGVFGDHRKTSPEGIKWQMEGNFAPLSAEEKAKFKAECAARDALRQKERAEKEEKKSVIATNIWDAASEDVPADHDYLKAKQVKAYGLRVGPWSVWVPPVEKEDRGYWKKLTDTALLMPLVDVFNPKKIWSLQAIVPPSSVPEDATNKLFLPGGAKMGRYHMIGKPKTINDRMVFILCEGYATGASIHEATGHAVIVCLDAGNLVNVAKALKEKLKKSGKNPRFLIGGDNDQFTFVKSVPNNAGRKKGKEAAEILGGQAIFPQFASLEGEPTDFNDLHCREGLDVVAAQFDIVLNPPPPVLPSPLDDDEDEEPADASGEEPAPWAKALDTEKMNQNASIDRAIYSNNPHFRFLGHRSLHYFFYVNAMKEVVNLKTNQMQASNLYMLAPKEWWDDHYLNSKDQFEIATAQNDLIKISHIVGPFDEAKVRAPGAWRDGDALIFHYGTGAIYNGKDHPLRFIPGNYVYTITKPLVKIMTALTDVQAREVRNIANRLRWRRPQFANLLCGWTFLAPICGILPWRPHIWITGPAGSGKSTVLNHYAGILGDSMLYFQGNSSEAGIRQTLRNKSQPVGMDEAESNDRKSKESMAAVMTMARQASSLSRAKTAKGSASGDEQSYLISSMFMFGSINPQIDKKADSDRFTLLELNASDPTDAAAKQVWLDTEYEMRLQLEDESFSDRWVSRSVMLMPEILKAVNVFRRIGLKAFGSQRNTDQLGTLMAGDYMLDHDVAPSEEVALAYLEQFDWSDSLPEKEDDDAQQALSFLLSSLVKYNTIEYSVRDLLARVYAGKHNAKLDIPGSIQMNDAITALSYLGMKYDEFDGRVLVLVSMPGQLKKMIAEQSFSTNLPGQLMRIPGAERTKRRVVRGDGAKACVAIPIHECLDVGAIQEDLPL